MGKTFYVYEHWRPDKDIPFYVGKGSGDRSDPCRTRNVHHTRIKKKLSSMGMCVEVRMVASGLSEQEALNLEIKRIAFWRSEGIYLANATSGGDGLKSPSEEVRQKMRFAAQKRWSNEQTRKNHGILTKIGMEKSDKKSSGTKGKKLSEETKKKMSISAKKQSKEWATEKFKGKGNPFFGKKHSEETLRKIAEKKKGSFHSEETKARMKDSQRRRRLLEKGVEA